MLEESMVEYEEYLNWEEDDNYKLSPELEMFDNYLRTEFKNSGEFLRQTSRESNYNDKLDDLMNVEEEARTQTYQMDGQDKKPIHKNIVKPVENSVINFAEIAAELGGKIGSDKYAGCKRDPTIWEFMVRLLGDSRTNPELISWEDRESGKFKLNKPNCIIYLWSLIKNKPAILYDNLIRNLRYHYKSGALFKVEGDYMYGFGRKAMEYYDKTKK